MIESIVTSHQITIFHSLFRGREDVFARFWQNPEENKSGYAPAHDTQGNLLPFSSEIIARHLPGQELIGIYPLLRDNTSYFLVIDFDQKGWLQEAGKVLKIAKRHGFPGYLERSKSGNGGHLWFFFTDKVAAYISRQVAKYFLYEADLSSETSFDRIFPTKESHSGKEFGNLIALPLHGAHLKNGNTAFITPDGETIPDQWQYLESFSRITPGQFAEFFERQGLHSFSFPKSKGKPVSTNTHASKRTEEKSLDRKILLILRNDIHIPHSSFPGKLYQFLKEKLVFSNPRFYELEGQGYSTWNTPRIISTLTENENGISIPAGFLAEMEKFSAQNGFEFAFRDERILFPPIHFHSKITLYPEQQASADELLKHDRIILEAGPGFGKTMVALHCIASRGQKTLIIVHTKALLYQWQKRIEDYFQIHKGDMGIIGDNRFQIGAQITIASYQTLLRHASAELKDAFGFVVVDECHHVPAKTFSEALSIFAARYVLGLTATAIRKDKLERLMRFYVGPVMKALVVQTDEGREKVQTNLIVQLTEFQGHDTSDFHELMDALIRDPQRNDQIIENLSVVLATGAKCLILTERIDHCQ